MRSSPTMLMLMISQSPSIEILKLQGLLIIVGVTF